MVWLLLVAPVSMVLGVPCAVMFAWGAVHRKAKVAAWGHALLTFFWALAAMSDAYTHQWFAEGVAVIGLLASQQFTRQIGPPD